ncbi:MAG: preprotein translocase subunit SecG [Verrucomicrobia bacterium]|nr:preprotein translocase subunit SecG [Verrucomicrobiota bacterium]
MSLAINLLTFVLVLLCLLLGLLILIQLPKKEAGLGQAFGGATTEALFGAGSGNALTQMTKYSAGGFLALCVLLAWMNANLAASRTSGVEKALKAEAAAAAATPAVVPSLAPSNAAPGLTTPATGTPVTPAPVSTPVTPAPAPAPGTPTP